MPFLSDDSMACILVKSPLNAIFEDQVRKSVKTRFQTVFTYCIAGFFFGGTQIWRIDPTRHTIKIGGNNFDESYSLN